MDKFDTEPKAKVNTYSIIDLPQAPVIVGKRQAEQLFTDNVQNYQNNDMSFMIRQSYRTFLMSDVNSPDIYLALAQI